MSRRKGHRSKITVQVQAPLVQQKAPLDSEARFKCWRWGRRAGKTRGAFIASTLGHGAKPNGLGMMGGGNILWVARDYTQADVVWTREIRPRFKGKEPAFKVNESKHLVTFSEGGEIKVASAENIDSERGDHWDGVVIDEGAHVNLDRILQDVIRPGLMDTKGWLIVMSTTKPGSHFNTLCEEIDAGRRPGWEHTHRTGYENPKIEDAEMDLLISSYTDPVKLACEVYAELTIAGGQAFGEWHGGAHVWRPETVPGWWMPVGVMDWGFVKPGYFALARIGDRPDYWFQTEHVFRETGPFQVGVNIATHLKARQLPIPAYVLADAQMWVRAEGTYTTADKVAEGMAEVWGHDATPALLPAPKGPGSRIQGVVAMHAALAYETENDDGVPEEHEAPTLRFDPSCEYAIRTIPRLARDRRNPEDVDTDGEDHAFDAIKGLLLQYAPEVSEPDDPWWAQDTPEGRHPGIGRHGRRKKRKKMVEDFLNERMVNREPRIPGGEYVVPSGM